MRITMVKGAYQRACEFNWEVKMEKLNVIYNSIVNDK
jgi:hypothetical protein